MEDQSSLELSVSSPQLVWLWCGPSGQGSGKLFLLRVRLFSKIECSALFQNVIFLSSPGNLRDFSPLFTVRTWQCSEVKLTSLRVSLDFYLSGLSILFSAICQWLFRFSYPSASSHKHCCLWISAQVNCQPSCHLSVFPALGAVVCPVTLFLWWVWEVFFSNLFIF